MKNVHIIEKKTGDIVATVPVQLQGMNYIPTAQEYEAAAWKAAVSDKLVNPKRKDDYSFRMVDAPPPFGTPKPRS